MCTSAVRVRWLFKNFRIILVCNDKSNRFHFKSPSWLKAVPASAAWSGGLDRGYAGLGQLIGETSILALVGSVRWWVCLVDLPLLGSCRVGDCCAIPCWIGWNHSILDRWTLCVPFHCKAFLIVLFSVHNIGRRLGLSISCISISCKWYYR